MTGLPSRPAPGTAGSVAGRAQAPFCIASGCLTQKLGEFGVRMDDSRDHRGAAPAESGVASPRPQRPGGYAATFHPFVGPTIGQRGIMAGRVTRIVTLLCALALSEACSSPSQPGDPDPSPTIVPVQGVKVSPQVVVLSAIGDTWPLTATISPDNATDQAVVWESTDSTVVTVDALGLVTAQGVGSGVFITAYSHDGHHQSSANVSVNP